MHSQPCLPVLRSSTLTHTGVGSLGLHCLSQLRQSASCLKARPTIPRRSSSSNTDLCPLLHPLPQAPAGLPTFDCVCGPTVDSRLYVSAKSMRQLLGRQLAEPPTQAVTFVTAAPDRREYEASRPKIVWSSESGSFSMMFYGGWAAVRVALALGVGCHIRLAWDAAAAKMHIAKLSNGGAEPAAAGNPAAAASPQPSSSGSTSAFEVRRLHYALQALQPPCTSASTAAMPSLLATYTHAAALLHRGRSWQAMSRPEIACLGTCRSPST